MKKVMSTCPGLNLVQSILAVCLDVYLLLAKLSSSLLDMYQDLSQPTKFSFIQSVEVFYRSHIIIKKCTLMTQFEHMR